MPVDQSCCACLPALSPPCLPARQSASLPAWLPARRPVHRPAGKTLLSGGPSLVLIHPVYLDAASSLQELSTLCCLSLLKNFAHNWPLALKMLIRLLLLVPVAASPFFVLFLVAPPPPNFFTPAICLPACLRSWGLPPPNLDPPKAGNCAQAAAVAANWGWRSLDEISPWDEFCSIHS